MFRICGRLPTAENTAFQQRRVAFCTVLFLSSDRLTADHRLSATCETELHVPTRRKFVSVCDLFLFTVRVYTMLSCMLTCNQHYT